MAGGDGTSDELVAGGADGPARANRMAFVYVPNGKNMVDWTPKNEGAGFDLPPILEPLADVRNDLLVLTGLVADAARRMATETAATMLGPWRRFLPAPIRTKHKARIFTGAFPSTRSLRPDCSNRRDCRRLRSGAKPARLPETVIRDIAASIPRPCPGYPRLRRFPRRPTRGLSTNVFSAPDRTASGWPAMPGKRACSISARRCPRPDEQTRRRRPAQAR